MSMKSGRVLGRGQRSTEVGLGRAARLVKPERGLVVGVGVVKDDLRVGLAAAVRPDRQHRVAWAIGCAPARQELEQARAVADAELGGRLGHEHVFDEAPVGALEPDRDLQVVGRVEVKLEQRLVIGGGLRLDDAAYSGSRRRARPSEASSSATPHASRSRARRLLCPAISRQYRRFTSERPRHARRPRSRDAAAIERPRGRAERRGSSSRAPGP